ncbi:DUF2306 domain-containing protein [Empedobacter brevis]|uniref:DUF2306 domain-containing protein n=1 Tax=Empedobacter brevis TaxID=247 RepID=A0AAJ1QGB0_9FLAO|nr:DUF2306 domain-containing protein [Empedobacter brevis]MDM1073553.1 DUF2306 domain-containing protein [Empedobacter brevis]
MNYLETYWLTSKSMIGAVHFLSASVGLGVGLLILILRPGTKLHKRLGYIFVSVLLCVNITALFIHELGMRFGPFHYMIPFSVWSLYRGIRPFISKKFKGDRIAVHIKGMVAAALGLWAAFFAELFVRVPVIREVTLPKTANPVVGLTIVGVFFFLLFVVLIFYVTKFQLKRIWKKK